MRCLTSTAVSTRISCFDRCLMQVTSSLTMVRQPAARCCRLARCGRVDVFNRVWAQPSLPLLSLPPRRPQADGFLFTIPTQRSAPTHTHRERGDALVQADVQPTYLFLGATQPIIVPRVCTASATGKTVGAQQLADLAFLENSERHARPGHSWEEGGK